MSRHRWSDEEMRETIRVYLRHLADGVRGKDASEAYKKDVMALLKRLESAGVDDLTFEDVRSAVNAVRAAERERSGGATQALRQLWATRTKWLGE